MTFPRMALAAGLLAAAFAAGAQTAPRKTYIVQLSDAPAATYTGSIAGLAATRPAPGARLDASAANVRAYVNYLDTRTNAALSKIGTTKVMHRYSLTFNGFAAQLTDTEAKALKTSAGVLSVTPSQIRKLDTTRTPGFLGISAPGGLWSQLDASSRLVKGEDVIIGMVDSGVWPEDPSFGDKVANGKPVAYNKAGTLAYGPPPAKWKGTCLSGQGFTAAMCNNKLIGARFYVDDFKASNSAPGSATLTSFEYQSPRDGGGHGTHTASTAGGNSNVDAVVDGIPVGTMSGIAPRARLAVYKICWEATTVPATGCYDADTLKAIDQAVADGVDVINFSISGSQTSFVDPTEIAFFNAAAAGVFVAASAGNSGPANQVAHPSPWITTVAASTHDRFTVATVTLGAPSGATFSGPSYQTSGLSSKPLILSQDAGVKPYAELSAVDKTALLRCYNPTDRADATLGGSADAALDPSKVAGKIVVCIRGGNVLVNKADSVKAAGGVGMIIQNAPGTNNTTPVVSFVIPTVHLALSSYTTVTTYAATAGATASFGPGIQQANVVAPVMADFSSRGPILTNSKNILKPDISGPGVDIIAGYIDASLTQAQHDALAVGQFTPQASGASLQGTSMSSPHVAGAAALLRQAHPTWSPAAVKSAMMTTTTDIKLASGALDPDRWGYGAGHMNPNGATDPGLVYDAGTADYAKFLCGLQLTPPAGAGTCATLGSIDASNLNLASITAGDVPGVRTLTRRVTNVGAATVTYVSSSSLPGWTVKVTPASLTLAPGASASFDVTLTQGSAPSGAWTFGTLAWSDGTHVVRSPLTARALAFVAPSEVSDTRVLGKGTKVYSIVSSYTGSLTVVPTGLVPATVTASNVALNADQCFDFAIGAGAQAARFQLFNADTQGGSATDLDLTVYAGPGGTGSVVGSSGSSTSNEVVTLLSPASGTYSACVTGYAVPSGGAAFKLSSWVVGPAVGVQTLKAAGPRSVYVGGAASIGLGWNVDAGKRYLGNVQYQNDVGAPLGSTLVYVDNH